MTGPLWLDKALILALYEDVVAASGGAVGVRDDGLLESALARPVNLRLYEGVEDILTLGATYCVGIARCERAPWFSAFFAPERGSYRRRFRPPPLDGSRPQVRGGGTTNPRRKAMVALKVERIGDRTAVVLTEETLAILRLRVGDTVRLEPVADRNEVRDAWGEDPHARARAFLRRYNRSFSRFEG